MNQYHIYFYNFDQYKFGFDCWQDAFNHLKDCCYEGGVYDNDDQLIVSWSPINGILWQAEVS